MFVLDSLFLTFYEGDAWDSLFWWESLTSKQISIGWFSYKEMLSSSISISTSIIFSDSSGAYPLVTYIYVSLFIGVIVYWRFLFSGIYLFSSIFSVWFWWGRDSSSFSFSGRWVSCWLWVFKGFCYLFSWDLSCLTNPSFSSVISSETIFSFTSSVYSFVFCSSAWSVSLSALFDSCPSLGRNSLATIISVGI